MTTVTKVNSDFLLNKRKNKFSLKSFQRQNTKYFKFYRFGQILFCKNKKNKKTFYIQFEGFDNYYKLNYKSLVFCFPLDSNIDLIKRLIKYGFL